MSGPAQNIHNIYDPLWEHDACGIGAVVNLKGTPSHATVDSALKIVEKLEHRAGKDATGETGDGVGLMIQVPHKLMVKAASAEGIALGGPRDYGVGMFFFPADALKRAQAQKMLEIIASKEGLDFLGWRDVPTHPEVLGRKALDCMPCICQCFVARPVDCARGLDFDRKLYVVRREFEQSNVNTYICSFSSRTIVYKGMFLVGQLRKFYTDLTEPDCESAIALVHSRFSTNTTPSWERAHPNRYILHNGEINTIRGNVDRAYKNGTNILILSDRGVDENHVAIPSLLAVSALEQYLVRTKKRTAVSMILESAEPRDVHHFATLLGYGAQTINPYLAQECVEELVTLGMLDKDPTAAVNDYNSAILHGIVKIASKMGISTIQSYQSAQIFECLGINRDVVDKYFTNTVSRVEGIGLAEIEEGVEWNHSQAFDPLGLGYDSTLDSTGIHKLRSGPDKEDHMYNPRTILLLQKAVREGSYETFKEYSALVDEPAKPHTLRGLLDFQFDESGGISIDEVEPVASIVKRFKTGAMSYGSISQEAHECLAIAMNRIGGKSNSGEGGEDAARLRDERCSAIKQVASGRFGVTSAYLTSAQEIQIKMAQGAKPGEGGHLPGKKVYPWIARTRCSTPGVTLISPPPHHDIYSIEDLAQLIYDLKNANRRARISVKLVSEAGVGTIAAGVAKAGAQVVLISGHDGGTGAAPRSSIHGAGLPWELGVAEAHQALIANGLRSQVALEADGKLMTGRDVAIACMLGAEEFGFATAPLVALGCCMMRVCNLDTCPAGIATQNPQLRSRFSGKPEYVVNFMEFVAQELREYMAALGIRTVDELVGRSDLLRVREKLVTHRAETLDLRSLLENPWSGGPSHFNPGDVYDFHLERTLDESVLLAKLGKTLKGKRTGRLELTVSSTDRAFGTLFGAEITRQCGDSLPDDSYVITCHGGGGQSFGAFISKGLTLELEGDCNDGLGKGLSGGKLVLYPPKDSTFDPGENIIVGNVALYGATSGQAFINGMAGERFCVRNSGAIAVVEGVGDHGCEYMTGGRCVILGPTGKNFAAGMSGGIAYVLDEKHDLYMRLNKDQVMTDTLTEPHDIAELRSLIEAHVAATGSPRGKKILAAFHSYVPCFKKVMPRDYDRMLRSIAQYEEKGMTRQQAEIEAFYANTRA